MTLRAYGCLVFLSMTFQTRPNPPLPMILLKLKEFLLSTLGVYYTLLSYFKFFWAKKFPSSYELVIKNIISIICKTYSITIKKGLRLMLIIVVLNITGHGQA